MVGEDGGAPETVTAAPGEAAPPPPPDAGIPSAPFEGMAAAEPALEDDDDEQAPPEPERRSVMYSCLRCNTPSTGEELDRLPEIKCICGFRVFVKNRPPVVKTIKAV